MLAIAAVVTFVLTTVLSMAGVGAAFILIPVFLALGVELHSAMATALLLNAIAMSIASYTFIRKGLVEWRMVVPMLLIAVIASPVGVHVGGGLDRKLLLWLFVAFLLFACSMMLFYRPKPRAMGGSVKSGLMLGLPVGAAAGFIGGLLGVGGGNIIVPALVAAGLEPKRASASASFVVIFASLAGFLAHTHRAAGRTLVIALVLTLGYAVVELLAGWRAGSLALLADAGHMVTDGAAPGLSALAAWLASLPPNRRHSYGLGKAELLAALVNALAMLAVVFGIGVEAWQRLQSPGSIDGATVGVVAIIGLLVNLLVAWILSRGEQNLNVRGAMLHVMGDVLGSVAAIVAGAVIYFRHWTPIDPLLSLLIGGLILSSSLRLLKEALHGTLDGVPAHIDLEELGRELAGVQGVKEIHDLHVWPIASEKMALSAHVRIANLAAWPEILIGLSEIAEHKGIQHVTFQAELHSDAPQAIRFSPQRPM